MTTLKTKGMDMDTDTVMEVMVMDIMKQKKNNTVIVNYYHNKCLIEKYLIL